MTDVYSEVQYRSLSSKSRALTTARHMIDSYLGIAVIKNHAAENSPSRGIALRRLEFEQSWRQRQLQIEKRLFLSQRSRRPGPIVVFDRPPLSRDYSQRVFLFQDEKGLRQQGGPGNKADSESPRYMRSTVSSSNHTSVSTLISTLDAFQPVNVSRSRTAYGTASLQQRHRSTSPLLMRRRTMATPTLPGQQQAGSGGGMVEGSGAGEGGSGGICSKLFRLAVQPSWPLTEQEQRDLEVGWQTYVGEMQQAAAANRRRRRPLTATVVNAKPKTSKEIPVPPSTVTEPQSQSVKSESAREVLP